MWNSKKYQQKIVANLKWYAFFTRKMCLAPQASVYSNFKQIFIQRTYSGITKFSELSQQNPALGSLYSFTKHLQLNAYHIDGVCFIHCFLNKKRKYLHLKQIILQEYCQELLLIRFCDFSYPRNPHKQVLNRNYFLFI